MPPDDGDIQVTGSSQTLDNDVAHVPVDGYVAVQCDRHVHTNTQNDTDCDLPPDDGDIQVTGNSQSHDIDVTNVPVDGYVIGY